MDVIHFRMAGVTVLLAVLGVSAGLSGCRGPSSSRSKGSAEAAVRAAQARAVAAQAGLGTDVQSFLAKAAAASNVTYTVVYEQGGGQSTTVMAEAPDRRIDVVGAAGTGSTDRIIIRGSDTVVCHLDAKHWTCVSGVTSAPGGPFTPEAISTTIASLAQLSQTFDFAVSARTMLGLPASCLTATRRVTPTPDTSVGDRAVICIAPSGVILRVEEGASPAQAGQAVQATSYRESVPSGAFDLPARPTPAVTTPATSSAPSTRSTLSTPSTPSTPAKG